MGDTITQWLSVRAQQFWLRFTSWYLFWLSLKKLIFRLYDWVDKSYNLKAIGWKHFARCKNKLPPSNQKKWNLLGILKASSILQFFKHLFILLILKKRREIKVLLINLECMYTAMCFNSWTRLSLKHFIILIHFHQYMMKRQVQNYHCLLILFGRGFCVSYNHTLHKLSHQQ